MSSSDHHNGRKINKEKELDTKSIKDLEKIVSQPNEFLIHLRDSVLELNENNPVDREKMEALIVAGMTIMKLRTQHIMSNEEKQNFYDDLRKKGINPEIFFD